MIDISLYAKDSRGKMRVWRCWQASSNLIQIEYGTEGGSLIDDSEIVDYGLGGRSQQEQIKLRIMSRAKKKTDAGYVDSLGEAMVKKRTNALGFARPMLAARFDKIKAFQFKANYVQMKYDGHRCMIINDFGELKMYSRNGIPIVTMDHILEELQGHIDEGETVDGELYCHGLTLQKIGSIAKNEDSTENRLDLSFICYDTVSDKPYRDRLARITSIFSFDPEHSQVANTGYLVGWFDMKVLLKQAIDQGYEGLIVRPDGELGYQEGKRSKGLIKVKAWLDDEYEVLSLKASVDGWAILVMKHEGATFSATSPGTFPEKKHVLDNPELYIGKKVNVQYAFITKDGVPFQPVAMYWRDKENE